MLINDYVRIPLRHENPDSFAIRKDLRGILGLNVVYPDYWVINCFDGKITNVENMIIWVFMFWGFLRFIDLNRLILSKNVQ